MPFQFTCERCGAAFFRHNISRDKRPHRYCSYACRDAPRPGIPQPDGTVLVPLTKGKFAIIDADDAPMILTHNWCYSARYAVRASPRDGGPHKITLMHRQILGLTDPEVHGDHINGNGLDNRRQNLRAVDRSENMANMKTRSDNQSGVRGVHFHKSTGKWVARIKFRGVETYLGVFESLEDAAAAREAAAVRIHGEFARLNAEDRNVIR